MVTPLKYFSKDPNGLGRGAGVYYHRGHGYFSKWDKDRDYNRHSTGWQTDRIGLPTRSSFLQTGDGRLPKYFKVIKYK